MKILYAIALVIFLWGISRAASQMDIRGGRVSVQGGYLAIGPRVAVSTGTIADTTGQCMGMLCGVTYSQ